MRSRIDRNKREWLVQYKKEYKATIKDFSFTPGDLVLVRNMEIESSLDKKMKPQYNGPMIVISRKRGGSYVLAEMDGAILHQKVGVLQVIPYFARKQKNIHELIDVSTSTLKGIESAEDIDREIPEKDFLFEDVRLQTGNNEFLEDEETGKEGDSDAQ